MRRFECRRSTPALLVSALFLTYFASPSHVAARGEPSTARSAPLFDFHSNFWVNLHQVLFHEAKLRAGMMGRELQGSAPLSTAHMRKHDEKDWDVAVRFYVARFGSRRQHGDDELIEINDVLASQADDGTHLNPTGLSPDLVSALQRAARVYRLYWWHAHNDLNLHWIATQKDRLRDLGPRFASAMTEDLDQSWPEAPIRVDVCHYVVALGHAFTTTSPAHTTFSSFDPLDPDLNDPTLNLSAFELLFHEASHTFADTMTEALSNEGRMQRKDVGDLWHAALFYTSGVELRRLLPTDEQVSFVSYADRYRVYAGGNWPEYRSLLATDWQARLDGKLSFIDAIHLMVVHLP